MYVENEGRDQPAHSDQGLFSLPNEQTYNVLVLDKRGIQISTFSYCKCPKISNTNF